MTEYMSPYQKNPNVWNSQHTYKTGAIFNESPGKYELTFEDRRKDSPGRLWICSDDREELIAIAQAMMTGIARSVDVGQDYGYQIHTNWHTFYHFTYWHEKLVTLEVNKRPTF